MPNVRTRSHPLTVGLICLGLLSTSESSLRAETTLLRRQSLPLRPGLVMDFATRQEVGFRDSYVSRVRIDKVLRGAKQQVTRVRFQWRMFQAQRNTNYDQTGSITTTGLPHGRAFNAWWAQGRHVVTSDTHLWFSRQACLELKTRGQTRYVLDRNHRRDKEILITKERTYLYETTLNGQRVQLRAWGLRSERGDSLTLLTDCEHPLVLQMDLPGVYAFMLKSIRMQNPKTL